MLRARLAVESTSELPLSDTDGKVDAVERTAETVSLEDALEVVPELSAPHEGAEVVSDRLALNSKGTIDSTLIVLNNTPERPKFDGTAVLDGLGKNRVRLSSVERDQSLRAT